MESNESLPRLAYRPDELQSILGIGKTKVFDLLKSGEIRSIKKGGVRLVPVSALEEFLAGRPEPENAAPG
jgi:excisionase family DNA binding protein